MRISQPLSKDILLIGSSANVVSGQKDGKQGKLNKARVATARTVLVPGVNSAGTWGRWAFIEITDPWDAQNAARALLATAPDAAERRSTC